MVSLEHRTTGARPKSVCFVTFVVGIVRRPTVCYVLSAQSKVKPLARLWIFDCKIPFPPTTVCVFRVPRGWVPGVVRELGPFLSLETVFLHLVWSLWCLEELCLNEITNFEM